VPKKGKRRGSRGGMTIPSWGERQISAITEEPKNLAKKGGILRDKHALASVLPGRGRFRWRKTYLQRERVDVGVMLRCRAVAAWRKGRRRGQKSSLLCGVEAPLLWQGGEEKND